MEKDKIIQYYNTVFQQQNTNHTRAVSLDLNFFPFNCGVALLFISWLIIQTLFFVRQENRSIIEAVAGHERKWCCDQKMTWPGLSA